jgi:dihydroflavonol-4-reductase
MKSSTKVLVTGGTGFLGKHVVRHLLDSGENLRVLDIHTDSELAGDVETIEGSVTDPAAVAKALKNVERVYHLAGKVSRNPGDKPLLYNVHVEGTRIVCREARRARIERIVMSSTSGTIAVTEDGKEVPDETWPPPIRLISGWPYYTSKLYQEEMARRELKDGPELVMVNPSILLGPGDATLSSSEDIIRFLSRDVPAVPPGGINFIDVRDAASALVNAMERGENGERYLVGGPNWTFETFFGRLERMTKIKGPRIKLPDKAYDFAGKTMDHLYKKLGKKPPVDRISMEMGRYFWYLDCSKAKRRLGFEARDPGETLYETVHYLKEHFFGNRAFG